MAALAVMATDMYAQTRKVQNKPYIDNRRFHYGFLCAVHSQSMSFENNGHINETTGEQWYAANDRGDIGFSIHRPYLLAGLNATYDLTSHKQDAILTKPISLYAEFGLGCDFYMPFFKLIPEIKFCVGLNDILDKNRKDLIDKTKLAYSEAVNSAKSSMVMITFYFE